MLSALYMGYINSPDVRLYETLSLSTREAYNLITFVVRNKVSQQRSKRTKELKKTPRSLRGKLFKFHACNIFILRSFIESKNLVLYNRYC